MLKIQGYQKPTTLIIAHFPQKVNLTQFANKNEPLKGVRFFKFPP